MMNGLAKMIGDAASGFFRWVWGAMNSGSSIDLWHTPDKFLKLLAVTLAIGLVIGFGAAAWEIASAAYHGGDLPRIGEAMRGVAVCTLGPGIAYSVLGLLITATDRLTTGLMDLGLAGTSDSVASSMLVVPPNVSVAGLIGLGLVWILIAFCQWIVVTVQAALIWIEVLLLPIAFAGAPHPALRPWVGKSMGLLIGAIFGKVVIVMVTVLGLALMGSVAVTPQYLGMGLVVMVLAVLAPFQLMSNLSSAGESLGAAANSGSAAGRGANPVSKLGQVMQARYYMRRK